MTAKYFKVEYMHTGSYAPGVLDEEYRDGMPSKCQYAPAEHLFSYQDKISVIINVLQVRIVCLDNFWPKQTKLQTHPHQNFSQLKIGQNCLNRQNSVYLVNNMSKLLPM